MKYKKSGAADRRSAHKIVIITDSRWFADQAAICVFLSLLPDLIVGLWNLYPEYKSFACLFHMHPDNSGMLILFRLHCHQLFF